MEAVSTQIQPAALNGEQLTRTMIAAKSSRAETLHPLNEMTQDASAEYPDIYALNPHPRGEIVRYPGYSEVYSKEVVT